MNKIYKVFISSTYDDLKRERLEVIEGIISVGCMPVAMEYFPASPFSPREVIKRRMEDCDYFVLILAGKYGSMSEEDNMSFTEMEYHNAVQKNLPILTFQKDENKLSNKEKETNSILLSRLNDFKNLQKGTIKIWQSSNQLKHWVSNSLKETFDSFPQKGFSKPLNYRAGLDFDQVKEQYRKVLYIKFLHLKKKVSGENPIYRRFIPRLEKEIEVFDEYVQFRINEFNVPVKGFECADYTSGTVDLNIITPWQPELIFSEGDFTRLDEKTIKQKINNPSNIFITATNYYNAFQANHCTRMRVEKDTKKARLIVDFTSLSGFQNFLLTDKVKGYLYPSGDNKESIELTVGNIFIVDGKRIELPGKFWIQTENLKKGAILHLEFKDAINWSFFN